MAIILRDNLQKDHNVPLISSSFLVGFIITLVAFLLPLFLVVQTHSKCLSLLTLPDYWVDTMTYFEQPDVRHMNEIIVWLYTDSKIYSFATTKSLNDYIDGSGEAGEELSPAFKVSPPNPRSFCL